MGKRGANLMSEKERDALVVLERVKRSGITMAEGSRLMGGKLPAMLAAISVL